jgi:type II secretory pathway pseudopilin PulG
MVLRAIVFHMVRSPEVMTAPVRRGFTILEAAVAVALVGMISVGALAAFGADLRASQRVSSLLPARSLAEERLTALELADATHLAILPDSLARGRFAPPFERYEWTASAKPVRGERWLYVLSVHVRWEDGAYVLTRSRFRPPTAVSAETGSQ